MLPLAYLITPDPPSNHLPSNITPSHASSSIEEMHSAFWYTSYTLNVYCREGGGVLLLGDGDSSPGSCGSPRTLSWTHPRAMDPSAGKTQQFKRSVKRKYLGFWVNLLLAGQHSWLCGTCIMTCMRFRAPSIGPSPLLYCKENAYEIRV